MMCNLLQMDDEDETPAVVDIEEAVPDASKNVELDKTRYMLVIIAASVTKYEGFNTLDNIRWQVT